MKPGADDMSDSTQPLTDEELLAKYRAAGESCDARSLLDELFRRLLIPAALCCYRCTGDHEWAADLAQEVLMQVFRSLDSFRGDSKISTWVYTIARNHCCKAIPARLEANACVDEFELEAMAGTGDDPYTRLARVASAESFRALLRETLTELEMRVITLHYGEELTLDAISKMLELRNASGAKAYIVSAKRKLQAALQQCKTGVTRDRQSLEGR